MRLIIIRISRSRYVCLGYYDWKLPIVTLPQQLDSDFYNVTVNVAELNGTTLEAPGIIKRDGKYYLFASHTSGWDPNPNKVFTASVSSLHLARDYMSLTGYDVLPGDLRVLVISAGYCPGVGKDLLLAERVRPPAR